MLFFSVRSLVSISSLGSYTCRVGIAYRWLQSICGLQFLTDAAAAEKRSTSGEPAPPPVSVSNLDATVRKLRRRVRARLALYRQLSACGESRTAMLCAVCFTTMCFLCVNACTNYLITSLGMWMGTVLASSH